MKKTLFLTPFLFFPAVAQDFRWQQRVEYTMNVSLDVSTHRVSGTQKLVYFNNSPDTLSKVYYHLYFNAFQPGSMMDERSRALKDPDRRVMDRISKLTDTEIGYQHILSLSQDGNQAKFTIQGTVMEVVLPKPLPPRSKSVFDMKFESQVSVQVRRSGRNNREGIAYSMTQWYPKIAEYDFQGWHIYPYVAREFHSVWGDFDVHITMNGAYTIAGTGKLQNPDKIGHGYSAMAGKPDGDLTWHFIAKNVIDFAWAADPEYSHDTAQVPNGPMLHFFYQKNDKTATTWKQMQDVAVQVFTYLNTHFGKYPFDTYSIIQGGDGGMEYPMCTLILGEGSLNGVVGTMAHEVAHSWFQMTLASNEALYPWMDEGFTDFASNEAMASIAKSTANPHAGSYADYFSLVASGNQEPLGQHADHYSTHRAYGTAAYSMGAIFLQQLKYIVGEAHFNKGMLLYYNTWKMRHPEPNDFIRIMEKVSGMQLHWYLRYWINTTKRIDYGISALVEQNGSSFVTLDRIGEFPMPIDLLVTYTDGTQELFYIPTNETSGSKPDTKAIPRQETLPWPWVNPQFTFSIAKPAASIVTLEIDPAQQMADISRKNNKWNVADKVAPYKSTVR